MTLSMCSKPGDALVRAGNHARAIEVPRERAMQDVLDQRRLAGARHAGDRDEQSERNLDVEVAQVVLARALDANRRAADRRGRRCAGIGISSSPRRILAR